MNELTRPIIRVWEYAGQSGGLPGQILLVVTVVILILGILNWLGNRH
jgi:hypothetical protein